MPKVTMAVHIRPFVAVVVANSMMASDRLVVAMTIVVAMDALVLFALVVIVDQGSTDDRTSNYGRALVLVPGFGSFNLANSHDRNCNGESH